MSTQLCEPIGLLRDNDRPRPRLAIIGTGISGMVTAHLLQERYDLTMFEANDYAGGHTHTVDVEQDGRAFAVDTGFIVYNERTYPHFTRLLKRLGVATSPTDMSFSVCEEASGTEYASKNLDTLFAQRRNLVSPRFLYCLREIVRFNAEAHRFLNSGDDTTTLTEMLRALGFSQTFERLYLTPMLASIWSADPSKVGEFPARHFLRFMENHGLISLNERPQWRTVNGGSREYVKRLIRPFASRILLSTPVSRVIRRSGDVLVVTRDGQTHSFDEVVIAAHSNEALAMLECPSPCERAVLGAIPYQRNDVVLHTDASLLPKRERAWASWNYRVPRAAHSLPTLTYNMNILQGLQSRKPFLVTLNETDRITPGEVLGRWSYWHPFYSRAGIAAQARHGEISGADRVHYCGAYWGYGFHEDGVRSALAVARRLTAKAAA